MSELKIQQEDWEFLGFSTERDYIECILNQSDGEFSQADTENLQIYAKQLEQRNKEFFIAGFEAGKLNEKKANHKMHGTIMHADSAYEAYLGYRDIQNES